MSQVSDEVKTAETKADEATPEAKPAAPKRRQRGRVYINEERCKGCGLCIAFCPTHVLERAAKFNTRGYHPPNAAHPENCTGCDICGHFCPDYAIYGVRIVEPAAKNTDNTDN